MGFVITVFAVLIIIGFIVGVSVSASIERGDGPMSLETTSGVVYLTQTIDGEEGVLIGKNRQAQWLSHQDLRELLETLEIPADIRETKITDETD